MIRVCHAIAKANSLLQLLHQNIDTVERKPYLVNNSLIDYNIPGKGHQICLKCKDLRIVTIEIGSAQDYLNVASSLEQLSNIKDPKMLYAFYYRPMYSLLENGFTMFRFVAYGTKNLQLCIIFFIFKAGNRIFEADCRRGVASLER